jgi:phosphoglycolate phosphatase-like HAD superfamily hydrolase
VRELILFDIDGTLVDVKGAGRRAFARAVALTWEIEDALADVKFGGATDLGVLGQLRRRLQLAEERDPQFFRHLEQALVAELTRERPHVYDGVHRYLQHLMVHDQVVLGLVTGNARRCAHAKVEHAGLDGSRFHVGGFGDEHPDRCALAALALERAVSATGPFDRVVLIGDTPSDILAAHSIGAVAVGVTTGHAPRQALVEAGADVIVDSLAELLPA